MTQIKDDLTMNILNLMRKKSKICRVIPNRDDLLLLLHGMSFFVGYEEAMFCNEFMFEVSQLLINSIFLYEDGYYDCAYYSVRQAYELLNTMLYLVIEDSNVRLKWLKKDRFELNHRITQKLEQKLNAYKEVKDKLADYFDHLKELVQNANKITHKQGYDTFYRVQVYYPQSYNYSLEKDVQLFTEFLKYTIGYYIIVYIIVDPISLALSDEEVTLKIHFDPLTEPAFYIDYFKNYLNKPDIIDKIKKTDFYTEFVTRFNDKEEMNPAVYSVIRDGYGI